MNHKRLFHSAILTSVSVAIAFAAPTNAPGRPSVKSALVGPTTSATICYADNKSVYILRPGSSKAMKLFTEKQIGDVQISPTGDSIAYTRDISEKDGLPQRQIAIYELSTSKTRVLKSTTGDNNYGPLWSPDGQWLVYRHYDTGGWEVGLAKADDSEGRIIVKHSNDKAISLEPTWWNADGQGFWAYDLDQFYEFDTTGKELKRVKFADMLGDVEQSSGYSFSLAPDGKHLLFCALKEVKDVDADGYPASLVFVRDMETGKCTRISPKGMQALSPAWLSEPGSLVYSGTTKISGVYQTIIAAPGATKPIAKGNYPYVSAGRP